ncbi:MAG TPA: HEAT repeat domain-containing protein [Gemmatimonadales bacterium]
MSSVGSLTWAAVAAVLIPIAACGQSLERQVSAAGDGNVQFHFTARAGVCGNGRNSYRSADGGSYYNFNNGNDGDDSCQRGPVRVVVVRAGHEIIRLETYAGPLSPGPDDGKDLGAIPAGEASAWLLGVANTLEGRPAREAIQPAMLADSTVVTPALTRIANDPTRGRDVRSSAISWLARRRDEAGGVGSAAAQHTLDALVRSQDESETTRRQALSALANLDRGEGIPLLIAFAGESDGWVVRQAMSSLANSGDPRARQFIRTAIKRADLPDETEATLIRGLGNEYATPTDYRLLRDLYPAMNSDQERSAVISTLGAAGGSDNVTWLLALAKSPTESAARRRQVVSMLSRSDDSRVKDALKGMVER